MRHRFPTYLVCAAVLTSCTAHQQANTTRVEMADLEEQVIGKTVATVPSERQWSAMEREFIAFVHFGPNTFTGREWGTGAEDPRIFAPTSLDTDQWCQAMADAGMRMVILTVKHHDGFVLWRSRYTKHGVISSSYDGDVLAELSSSCRRHGLKLGIYLSPADLHQMEDGGLYGNGSEATLRTIPKPVEGRPFQNQTTFRFEVDDYNEYFMSQLFEVLTEYGPIDEVWLDGAHPRRKGGQQYDYASWRKLIRTLVPDAAVFGREDIRWCGNESGDTRAQEWNVIPYAENPDSLDVYHDITDDELGTRDVLLSQQRPFYLHYQPCETDTSIRDGWFYRNDDEQRVRSADEVFDIYERSVGGNSILLLNIPPNTEGRFSQREIDVLSEVGRKIRETYGESLMQSGHRALVDSDPYTFRKGNEFDLAAGKAVRLNRVMLREPVQLSGERVEAFAIDIWQDDGWKEIYIGTNIGRKKIARIDEVSTEKIRVRVLSSRAEPRICEIGVYLYHE